uniref:Uncharacterized protein n=1 Tax=Aegilops tauschii subsp. strangulata TaxID=200361 RepID=A0A453NLG3_AEGTS
MEVFPLGVVLRLFRVSRGGRTFCSLWSDEDDCLGPFIIIFSRTVILSLSSLSLISSYSDRQLPASCANTVIWLRGCFEDLEEVRHFSSV